MAYRRTGYLERVDLETFWDDEPSGFAPWFVDADRLRELGAALGVGLEPVMGTLEAGPGRAGLVCTDTDTRAAVAIESQLGESDPAHIGALLVRAAECRASTAVWLAERFAEEHRHVLGCLNRDAGGATVFLGVEMGLWRIGDSRAALRFHVVVGPDGWPVHGPPPGTGPRRGRYPCRVLAGRSPVGMASIAPRPA